MTRTLWTEVLGGPPPVIIDAQYDDDDRTVTVDADTLATMADAVLALGVLDDADAQAYAEAIRATPPDAAGRYDVTEAGGGYGRWTDNVLDLSPQPHRRPGPLRSGRPFDRHRCPRTNGDPAAALRYSRPADRRSVSPCRRPVRSAGPSSSTVPAKSAAVSAQSATASRQMAAAATSEYSPSPSRVSIVGPPVSPSHTARARSSASGQDSGDSTERATFGAARRPDAAQARVTTNACSRSGRRVVRGSFRKMFAPAVSRSRASASTSPGARGSRSSVFRLLALRSDHVGQHLLLAASVG